MNQADLASKGWTNGTAESGAPMHRDKLPTTPEMSGGSGQEYKGTKGLGYANPDGWGVAQAVQPPTCGEYPVENNDNK